MALGTVVLMEKMQRARASSCSTLLMLLAQHSAPCSGDAAVSHIFEPLAGTLTWDGLPPPGELTFVTEAPPLKQASPSLVDKMVYTVCECDVFSQTTGTTDCTGLLAAENAPRSHSAVFLRPKW